MKNRFLLYMVGIIITFPLFIQGQASRDTYYSVTDVYTDPSINDGDDIQVFGYYTNTDYNLLMEFYGDFDRNEPFAPHSVLTLTGLTPPSDAWNGGYIIVSGIVTFEEEIEPYHPEDTLMANLEVYEITVIMPGESPPPGREDNQEEQYKKDEEGKKQMDRDGCDPCKFAFLLSGGVSDRGNHLKYWKTLEALYNFKVDSMGYCDSNVFVHYYKGTPRDGGIPAGRVIGAKGTKIDSSFQVIADRVAACNANGTPATFQKMISNHGQSDGDICLVGREVITPQHLRDNQQKVIDSCCRTVFDEFLQCYAGYVVDAVETLDTKNKATVYVNSNADHTSSHSPHDVVDPYLAAKILALDTGDSYPTAVVEAKLAYDSYLQQKIDEAHNRLVALRAMDPATPGRDAAIARWVADSTDRANKICKSRNVTITPFTHYCQWREYAVPPGGQLVVEFSGGSNSCGNVTVYRRDPVTGVLIKVAVWNWNNPGSYGYVPGNERRAINGEPTGSTTFWIHNDNDTSRITVRALGTPAYPESPSNLMAYPGFSFGGTDNSMFEFAPIMVPFYFIPAIDQLNIPLNNLPAMLGPEFIQQFGFDFQLDPTNPFLSDMELILNVLTVDNPNPLMILSSGSIPSATVNIEQPGTYIVELGDFTLNGPSGNMTLIPMDGLQFSLDSWGFRSGFDPPPLVTVWFGEVSPDWYNPDNWSEGIPGTNHSVIIMPGPFQPVILTDIMVKSVTMMEGANIITAPGATLTVIGK